MIAVERPAPTLPEPAPQRAPEHTPIRGRRRLSRPWAVGLVVALLLTLGGSGSLFDSRAAASRQAQALALHLHWAEMRADGVPDADLAALEQEWAYSQKSRLFGAATIFWWPWSSAALDRWQAQTDAIWTREVSLTRAGAAAAEQHLHQVLGAEPPGQLKARLDALAESSTPADFASLQSYWSLEAKLVPIDGKIAAIAGQVVSQALAAKIQGILSVPAADVLARADAYTQMLPDERMARAELLTRLLTSTQKDLHARLDAATTTQKAFTHAANEINSASIYGIDVSSYQSRVSGNRRVYASALTVAEFTGIATDLNRIVSSADSAIYVALSTTHIISGVAFYYQDRPLSCEEASTSMALTHQGIHLSQDQILAELGADRRAEYRDSRGRVRWGNPYLTFVGNVNGSESNFTGYGTYYPPLVRVARTHGARIIDYGNMSAATIYARVIAGHPVVAFATWDWAWHPRHDYLSFDGRWIPFIGPVNASHVYVVVGVRPGSVLINDPIRGQYWISKASFQAGYSDFNEAIVFA